MTTRSYSELAQIDSFTERFEYLQLRGFVGKETFGFDRWINQGFYRSAQWRRVRHDVIARDNACDLGVDGHDLYDKIIIHHINPMTAEDIEDGNPMILALDNLITVSHNTHNAIHYGDVSLLKTGFIDRRPGDTKSW